MVWPVHLFWADTSNPATADREIAAPEEPLEVSLPKTSLILCFPFGMGNSCCSFSNNLFSQVGPREILNEETKLEQRKQKQQRMKLDSLRRQSLSGN